MYTWHKVEVAWQELEENKIVETDVGEKKIALLKKLDVVHAFAAKCPHAGAPMCEGWLDPLGRVVCPLHKYRFDPANGRNTSGEGYKLFTYLTEIRGSELYVRFMA